jgi:hypothetical protein
MADWRTVLREVDARSEEDRLSPEETEAMRRVVLATSSTTAPEPKGWSWMPPMFVAATVVAMIAVGIVAVRRFDHSVPPEPPSTAQADVSPGISAADVVVPNRQLQFLTPGGTRIIWVFNSEFDLKATMR